METSNNGGPAFPATHREITDNSAFCGARVVDVLYPGMSLRDYFAIHGDQPGQLEIAAEAGVITREHCGLKWDDPKTAEYPSWVTWFHGLPQEERYRLYAAVRYRVADAMLKARG